MSGTRRTYNLNEKNYFKFFGIEEKQGISIRSLTTHYKKILNLLKNDKTFMGREKLEFAHRAFETLVDPITRARYIISLNGVDSDYRDSANAEDMNFIHQLQHQLVISIDYNTIESFMVELKDHTEFIKDQIEESIDEYSNYRTAGGLVNRFYEISLLHKEAEKKKDEALHGVTHVVFD